jgi:alpha-mannosidase
LQVKERNRRCEFLLQEVEQLWVLALARGLRGEGEGEGSVSYPKDTVDRLWKLLLLNQFHDVLPGSSIEIVS